MRIGRLQFCALFSLLLPASTLLAQSPAPKARTSPGDSEKAIEMAEAGSCSQALPLLKRAIRQTSDRDLKKRIGLDGLRCAMTHNTPYDSLDFLVVLSRD